MGLTHLQDVFDDIEIDSLESIRRYGYPDQCVPKETEYYTLPPSRATIMNDWREWRTQINDVMNDLIGKISTRQITLTSSEHMKIPEFFKGPMSVHGRRVKDIYAGDAIHEKDTVGERLQKKIMDENFFLFGIPRISLQRDSSSRPIEARRHSDTLISNQRIARFSDLDKGRIRSSCASSSEKYKQLPSDSSTKDRSAKITGDLVSYHAEKSNNTSTLQIRGEQMRNKENSFDSGNKSPSLNMNNNMDEHVYCEIDSLWLNNK